MTTIVAGFNVDSDPTRVKSHVADAKVPLYC